MSTGFHEDEHKFSGKFDRSIFQTLYFAYRDSIRLFSFLFTLGLMGRLLILFNANLVGYWVDQLNGNLDRLPVFMRTWTSGQFVFAMLLVTVAGMTTTLIFRVGFARNSARAVSLLYDETTLRTSRYPLSFFDATPVGRVITRFSSDYGNIFRMFGGPLAEFINIVFDLIAMLILAVNANSYFLIVAATMFIFYSLIYRLNRTALRTARRESSRARSPAIAHFAETAQGSSIIRAFSKEKIFGSRFSRLNHNSLTERLKTIKRIVLFSFEMNVTSALIVVGTGIGGYKLIEAHRLSVGELTVAFSFLLLASASLQMFFEWMSSFEEALVGVERMDEYLRKPIEAGLRLPISRRFPTSHAVETATPLTTKRRSGSASVEIKNLNFRYRPDLPLVLNTISLSIRAGEKLGVVGRTGSGKSTLVQCLYYLYRFESGEILIDDVKPNLGVSSGLVENEIPLTEFRKKMALISQESILFKGPLRDNLDMTHEFSDDALWKVLKRVGIDRAVGARTGGLDTIIDERGRNLSMGERQLICIARCLLQNAPVVVMDEPTSSIDPQTEEILMKATRELFSDRTQIIIAHRLSTLEFCDRILWLKNGSIFKLGPTAEILPLFKVAQQEQETQQALDVEAR